MRVVISERHLGLNKRLANEINRLAKNFNYRNYSKIESIDRVLLKRNISVEKKKELLLRKLHSLMAETFAVNPDKFNKKLLESFNVRLASIMAVIDKLRGITYYLETTFFGELRAAGIKIPFENHRLRQKKALANDELEALEYTAYELIGKAIILDKALLKEYSRKEKKVIKAEKSELKSLGSVLAKEAELLEHIEAKIPPARDVKMWIIKKPVFSHWAARILALLSYMEHIYLKEKLFFRQLKKNKIVKSRIKKKISNLIKEKTKLIGIMEQKALSMEKLKIDKQYKKELHNLTTIIRV